MYFWMCGLPLQCSLVTKGNILTENPFPLPQQLAITSGFLTDGGSFCPPFPLCRNLVWLELKQILSILWKLLLVHVLTNSAMSRKHCFCCRHLLPLALRLFQPSLPLWSLSLGKTQYGYGWAFCNLLFFVLWPFMDLCVNNHLLYKEISLLI